MLAAKNFKPFLRKEENPMKKTYSLYAIGFALVLVSGALLAHPPTTAFAASCDGKCQYGSDIHVSGTSCSCQDNVGCTWTDSSGASFTQKCATKNNDEGFVPVEGPAN